MIEGLLREKMVLWILIIELISYWW